MDKSLWRCSTFELVDSRYIYREESASLIISMAVWWATSLITFTPPPYKSRRSGLLTVLPDDVSKASKAYKRCKACIKLNYVTENLAPRTPRSCTGLGKLVKCNATRAQEGPLKIADKIRSLKRRKIGEIYFFSVFRLVINKPNQRFLSLILGFAVTVAIWPREFVSCRDFILRSVACRNLA